MVDGQCRAGRSGTRRIFENKECRHQKDCDSGFSHGLLGIVEPVMFGVNLKLVRPFIGASIGGALGGAYAVFTHVAANSYGLSGIPMISIILPLGTANLIHYLIAFAIAVISAFIATLCLGFKDEKE